MSDLDAIRERHAAASSGPWHRDRDTIVDALGQPVALVGFTAFPARDPQPWHRADAEFLTHAREDVGTLLAEVDRLRNTLIDTGIRERLAGTNFGDELAAEGVATVALDEDGHVIEHLRVL